MRNLILIITTLTVLITDLSAQNIGDAIRYSVLAPGGSARVLGAGNSFGAMGGDYGISSINVAGLADFRSTEVTISLSYNNPSTTSAFQGNQVGSSSNGNKVLIENIAFIKHSKPYNKKLVTSNFAIGLQQYSNFDQVYSYETTSIGSITELFTEQANLNEWSDFESELAFSSGAIFDDESDQEVFYFSDLVEEDLTRKEQRIERSGSYNEFQVSWAGKLKSGFNIGLGMGIPVISFEENKFYEENDVDGNPAGFNKLNFNESLTTSGVGINLKAGIGYNLKNKFRVGFSFQSPTFLRLEDLFYNSMVYECGACTDEGLIESPTGTYDYRLTTPMKLTGSIGGMMSSDKIKGFLNLDVQYVNYSQNSFDLSNSQSTVEDLAYQDTLNTEISTDLSSGINYAVGGELVFGRYRARAGFTAQLKPFRNELGTDLIYGTGLGYRGNQFYVDVAYQYRNIREAYIPYPSYSPDRELFLRNEAALHKMVLTFGVKI